MKGSHQRCGHCGAEEVRVNRANETIQCEACDRILEERYNDFRTTTVLLERESPFPVVTQDGLSGYRFDEGLLPDDPFHSTGFITGFSQASLQPMGAFTLTARTFPGDLAELERLCGELGVDHTAKARGPRKGAKPAPGGEQGAALRHVLEAYFHIQEVCDMVDIHRDDCEEAVRIFRGHATAAGIAREADVPNLAVGALVLALRAQVKQVDPETMNEVLAAAGCTADEVQQAVQTIQFGQLADKNTASEASSEEAIATFLPLFCGQLAMPSATQELARKISLAAGRQGVCGRRNPHSVAAAVIYLAFNLEDQKRTQTEICKVTGLTEVTLRKAYKELLACHQQILPPDYTPRVPLKRLLPSIASSSGFANTLSLPPAPAPEAPPQPPAHATPALAMLQAMQAMVQRPAAPAGGSASAGGGAAAAPQALPQMPFPFPLPAMGQGGAMSEAQVGLFNQFKEMMAQQYRFLQQQQQGQGQGQQGQGQQQGAT